MKAEIKEQLDIIRRSINNAETFGFKTRDSAMLDHLAHINNQVDVLKAMLEK
jgi:hypothetical protein